MVCSECSQVSKCLKSAKVIRVTTKCVLLASI